MEDKAFELKNITECAHNDGILYFQADGKEYKISQYNALDIMYTLYDSLNLSYKEPERIEGLIEKQNEIDIDVEIIEPFTESDDEDYLFDD